MTKDNALLMLYGLRYYLCRPLCVTILARCFAVLLSFPRYHRRNCRSRLLFLFKIGEVSAIFSSAGKISFQGSNLLTLLNRR